MLAALLAFALVLAGVCIFCWPGPRPAIQRANDSSPTPRGTGHRGPVPDIGHQAGVSTVAIPRDSVRDTIGFILAEIHGEPESARSAHLIQAADSLAPDHLRAVIAALHAEADNEAAFGWYSRLIRRWAAQDPRAAAAWVAGMPAGSAREDACEGIAIAWAGTDLSAAITWAGQLGPGDEQQQVLLTIAYEATRPAPATALAIAEALERTPARDDLMVHAVMQWAVLNPKDAAAWAGRTSDGALRERILATVATVWADRDPAQAANLALDSLAPGRPRDDAVIGIVQRWLQRDPAAVTAWVSRFPDGPLRLTAINTIAAAPD